VSALELELNGPDNPYAKEYGEDPNVTRARMAKQSAQQQRDQQALEATRQAIAEREAFEKMRSVARQGLPPSSFWYSNVTRASRREREQQGGEAAAKAKRQVRL
jgi:hypothetical protein